MPGMGGGIANNNPVIVDAFHAALRWQALVALLLALAAVTAWVIRRLSRDGGDTGATASEHPGRRLLRVSFGLLWILDGILQAQSAMPLGMPDGVVKPSASTSPAWVQHLVQDGLNIWTRHPIPAAASAVWIQVGIGALLLLSPRGVLSRVAGVVSIYWGLIVWVFGESFGGIFGSGLSWMFGAPGAVLIYSVAGLLVALPERAWEGRRLGRLTLAGLGAFFVGMAVLQAWPGRGFWQGQANPKAQAGPVTDMVQTMSQTPQPKMLVSLLDSFGSFDAAHGWAVNLAVVIVLASVGAMLLTGQRRLVQLAASVAIVACLADWVFVQDLGFFGGLGTDPNSMVPLALLVGAGALAFLRQPSDAVAPVTAEPVRAGRPILVLRPGATAVLGVTASVTAFAIVLLGAVPMAFATVNPRADAILTEAVNGTVDRVNSPAPPIDLVDQHGAPVSLATLRGRTVALTFLDPVCTTDCPIIAQQFRDADRVLAAPDRTAFVAVVANPVYLQEPFVQAFDRQEQLDSVPNWYYLTGSLAQLSAVWKAYGIEVETVPAGAMAAHSDNAFVIDSRGHLRDLLGSDPGDTSATAASLGTQLVATMRSVMGS